MTDQTTIAGLYDHLHPSSLPFGIKKPHIMARLSFLLMRLLNGFNSRAVAVGDVNLIALVKELVANTTKLRDVRESW